METPASKVGEALDLNNCDREPIHIPGAIQPHGMLLRLQEPDFIITHASASTESILSIPPRELIGTPLSSLIDSERIGELLEKLAQTDLVKHNPHRIAIRRGSGEKQFFDGIAHRFDGNLVLEMEPSRERFGIEFTDFYHQARESVQRLRSSQDINELFATAAAEVRRITGFDRVVVYKFDEHWNGSVLAEEREAHAASYLGLHFPASDIPRQARELYLLNRLRLIPTVDYAPSSILPSSQIQPDNKPLNLSLSVLRSVSPIHLEYLRNMGVTASMSVSLVKNNRLWGLISCTHESGVRYVPYDVRAICDFIGETVSSMLPLRESEADAAYQMRLLKIQSGLLQQMAQAEDFIDGLMDNPSSYLEIADASGGAIYYEGRFFAIGDAPDEACLQQIVDWLPTQKTDDVLCEPSLPTVMPSAEEFKDQACGLLAFSISKAQPNYFMWFRPERIQTVNWSGNPNKPAVLTDGSLQLHPRKSFALWQETVRLKSLPWKEEERHAVAALRSSIIEIVIQRMERLSRLNVELERSNTELDSFAYAASHDLKEPLRGISNYVNVVLRDAGHLLPEDSRTRMQTVTRLTQRMEDLINSLLHYSQIGRSDLMIRETDLNDVVRLAIEALKNRIEGSQVEIQIPAALPSLICDRIQMNEVFMNLISNAIKYNDKPVKTITIACQPNPEPGFSPIFSVADNGIGIDPIHFGSVFKIFKRLHPKNRYGGGTGTGLTITHRVIERHGGRIWLASTPGNGTTFYFTIPVGQANVE